MNFSDITELNGFYSGVKSYTTGVKFSFLTQKQIVNK